MEEEPLDEQQQFEHDLHAALLSFVPMDDEEAMVDGLTAHLRDACKAPLHFTVILGGFENWVLALGDDFDIF